MPVPWRNASLLPIQPVRIVLDGRPHFFGREREARSQPVHGARNIHANQNAANVEDEGAKPCSCHRLFALCAGSCNGTLIIGSTEPMPAPIDPDNRGKDGDDDDYGDDVMNALTNIRNGAAQGESAENHGADPKNPAKNIERQITGVRHLRGAGDGWAERPNDRNEAGEDDGSSTIFLVEVMGPLKVASPEEERIFAAVQRGTRRAANPVADLVTYNGAKHDRQEKPFEWDHAGSGKNSSGHQQGIPRKEKSHKKTGFNENDRADEGRSAGAN